ncbi:MAG: hypothetical protein JJU13_13630 [Balneolaceae bacterium]|nr:hypothetical protein [Balneolaceae bacterium]
MIIQKLSVMIFFVGLLLLVTSCKQKDLRDHRSDANNYSDTDSIKILFSGYPDNSDKWKATKEYEIRGRYVKLDSLLFSESNGELEDRVFRLNLFEDTNYTTTITRSEIGYGNVKAITGQITENGEGFVSITIEDGKAFGSVRIPSEKKLFLITYHKDSGKQVVTEVDENKMDIQIEEDPLYMDYPE